MRINPPLVADEREMLITWLDFHRETLALKCEGLDEEQLKRRAVAPSSLSLLGLVRHMADVERVWFQVVLAGEAVPYLYRTDTDPNVGFDDLDGVPVEEVFAAWRAEIDKATAILADWPDLIAIGKGKRHGQDYSLRWILVHMIEEYARHNGHADIIREQIDGVTGS